MTLDLSPAGWTLAVVAAFLVLLAIVILRVVTRDRAIRGIRLGVFYERERDEEEARK